MNLLGLLCLKSRAIPPDHAQARHWFQQAAAAGSAAAMHNLGALYEHGHGVALDYVQARGWYRRAAEAGNAHAAERLYRLAARLPQTGNFLPFKAPVGHRRLTPVTRFARWSGASTAHRSEPRESLAPC